MRCTTRSETNIIDERTKNNWTKQVMQCLTKFEKIGKKKRYKSSLKNLAYLSRSGYVSVNEDGFQE